MHSFLWPLLLTSGTRATMLMRRADEVRAFSMVDALEFIMNGNSTMPPIYVPPQKLTSDYCNFRCFESLGHQCVDGQCFAPTNFACETHSDCTGRLAYTMCLANDNVTQSCYLNVDVS